MTLELRVVAQEVGEKAKEGGIAENHRHRDAQNSLGLALAAGQDAFGVVEVSERLAALVEVVASLRGQREVSRRPLQQRDAELPLEVGDPSTDRRDWHRKRACGSSEAAELRHGDEDGDLVEVDHLRDISTSEK
jgi:hypothetical protein